MTYYMRNSAIADKPRDAFRGQSGFDVRDRQTDVRRAS